MMATILPGIAKVNAMTVIIILALIYRDIQLSAVLAKSAGTIPRADFWIQASAAGFVAVQIYGGIIEQASYTRLTTVSSK